MGEATLTDTLVFVWRLTLSRAVSAFHTAQGWWAPYAPVTVWQHVLLYSMLLLSAGWVWFHFIRRKPIPKLVLNKVRAAALLGTSGGGRSGECGLMRRPFCLLLLLCL
jgi:hypothetical protein